MTNDNNTRKKASAVFFAAIMVVSMVAIGFAAAPAAADLDGTNSTIDSAAAEPVTAGFDSSEQDVQVKVTISDTASDNVTVDLSEAADAEAVPSLQDVTISSNTAGSVNLLGSEFNESTNVLEFQVKGTTAGDDVATVTASFEHDLSNVEGPLGIANQLRYSVDAVTGTDSAIADFEVYSAEDVSLDAPLTEDNVNSADFTVSHPANTLDAAHEVSLFITGNDNSTVVDPTSATKAPDADSTTFTDVNLDSQGIASGAGDEIQFHAVLAADADNGTSGFEASLNNVQADGTATVDDSDADIITDSDWDGSQLWEGQTVTVDLSGSNVAPGDEVTVREVTNRNTNGYATNTRLARSLTVSGDRTISIETDRLRGEAEYVLRTSNGLLAVGTTGASTDGEVSTVLGASDIAEAQVLTQDLSAEFAEDEANNDEKIDVDVASLRGEFDVEVSGDLDDSELSEEELENIFDDESATGLDDGDDDTVLIEDVQDGEAFVANFTDVDGGNYSFDFDVEDTTASDTDSIEVTELGEGELTLGGESIVTEQQGDVANITVTFDGTAETGTLLVGDEDDVGYQGNITIDSNGEDEVNVLFNSYAAGSSGNGTVFELANPDDTDAELDNFQQNQISDVLSDGDYTLSVSTSSDYDDTLDDPDTIGTLVLEQRATTNQQIWTTSEGTVTDIVDAADADDEDGLEELNSQIEGDNVTQASTIAEGDYVIHQIEASGLSGLLAQYDDDPTTALNDAVTDTGAGIGTNDGALSLRVRQTQASTTANQDPAELQSNILGNMTVFADEETNNYYVVYDLDDTSAEDGEAFDARFRVQDERLLNPSDSDRDALSTNELTNEYYQSVTASFDVAEREFEFDQDPYNVTNAEGQAVSGTSNVAPGTEVNVRLRSASGTSPSFIETSEGVRVNADGTWMTEFDFSDTSVGDEYTFTVRQTGLDENPSVDGTVIEAVDDGTDDGDDGNVTDGDDGDDGNVTDGDDGDDGNVTDGDDGTDDGDDGTDDGDDGSDDGSDGSDGGDDGGDSEDGTPGFGALVALVALIAAALLATRRNE